MANSTWIDPLGEGLSYLKWALKRRGEVDQSSGGEKLKTYTLNYILDLGALLEVGNLDEIQRLLNKVAPME